MEPMHAAIVYTESIEGESEDNSSTQVIQNRKQNLLLLLNNAAG